MGPLLAHRARRPCRTWLLVIMISPLTGAVAVAVVGCVRRTAAASRAHLH